MTMRVLSTLLMASLVGLAIVAPLLFLQLRHTRGPDVPVALFVVLWMLPMAFVLTGTPLLRAWRTGQAVLQRPAALVARVALLVVLAAAWIAIVHDQLPCFFGVPNCD
jgi:hypothetical protein